MRFWLNLALWITAITLPLLVVAWASTWAAAYGIGLIITLVILLYHLRNLHALTQWLSTARPELVPEAWGEWDTLFSQLYRQQRKREKDDRRMSATLERFIQAAEALPDGIVVLSEGDRIEWCNRVGERHLGLDCKRDAGMHITYLIRQPRFVEYMHTKAFNESTPLNPDHNPELMLSIQVFPFEGVRKLLVTRDITQLEKITIVHREFVANVSHELRTPLTVVGGFLETLLDLATPNPDIERRYMQLMQEQTGRMARLVDDLLTLSRIENNSHHREENINVPQLINIIADEARTLSNGQHTLIVSPSANLWLTGNRDALHSALGNLVSNAVRYTPQGGTITLSWQQRGSEATFSVTDTGIGIDAEHLPRLTERFYRVDRSRSRETGGTGLGLAIVKHGLLRHQAKLDICSTVGVGSTFSATFPADRLTQAKGAQ